MRPKAEPLLARTLVTGTAATAVGAASQLIMRSPKWRCDTAGLKVQRPPYKSHLQHRHQRLAVGEAPRRGARPPHRPVRLITQLVPLIL